MIEKKEWFVRRKYSGWGLTPKTWQGFLYIGTVVAVGFAVGSLPVDENYKTIISGVLISIFVADILHIMATLKLDEREGKIEMIAERNASWTMVASLAVLLIYFNFYQGVISGKELMPYIIFPILAGMVAKGLSTFILQKRVL